MKKMISILFLTLLSGIMLLGILIPDELISMKERRRLAVFPKMTFDSVMSGEYMADLEPYLLDHMPFRETFMSFKMWSEKLVFSKKDINKLYESQNHLIKIEYPYKRAMGLNLVEYIAAVEKMYLGGSELFVSIIPDKNYFAPEDGLKMAYKDMINDLKSGDYHYVDLFDVMTLDMYYKNDPHWRQEMLAPVLKRLSEGLDFEIAYEIDAFDSHAYKTFYGAYAAQSGIKVSPEDLIYLSHKSFEQVIVKNYEKTQEKTLYNKSLLEGMDAYDVFLAGASPLIEIVNTEANSEKELIIFRDSFSSSLTPLLLGSYQKITLVDTRYLPYEHLGQYITFEDQDVLFLYSTLVVNNSVMLR